MRQDIPAAQFTVQALSNLSSCFLSNPSLGGGFGKSHPAYHSSNVHIAFGAGPSRSIKTSPSIAFGYNTPGVRFGNVTSRSSRPVSKEGKTSFHFSHTFLSKTSSIKQMIKEFHGGRAKFTSTAESHLLYIERDGAAERLEKNSPGPNQKIAPDKTFHKAEALLEARGSIDQQDYLERVGAPEILAMQSTARYGETELEIASFGTIGDTSEGRREFWRLVDKYEKGPLGERIFIDLKEEPTFWLLLKQNIGSSPCPLSDYADYVQNSDAPRGIDIQKVDTQKTLEIYKWLKGLHPDFPIDIEPGRGGRVQTRVIAELPHELEPHQRLEIVKVFTESLTAKKFPFWAVIHAPDENNDKRNFHVHIIYYDRPCEKIPDPANPTKLVWDFTVEEEVVYKSRNRKMVQTRMQQKLRETTKPSWIIALRKSWEQACNATLEKAGAEKRYDRRTYRAMGIDLDPLKHIPSKTFNKERRGEITIEGVDLARRQWNILLETVVNKNALRTHRLIEKVDARFIQVMKTLETNADRKKHDITEATKLHGLAKMYARGVGLAELMQDVARVTIDRVASRARLVYNGYPETPVKKRGRPRRHPPLKNVDGLTPEAREASRFLQTLITRAKEVDNQNAREVMIARGQFAVITRRLDEIAQYAKSKWDTPQSRASERVDTLVQYPQRRQEKLERLAKAVNTGIKRGHSPV